MIRILFLSILCLISLEGFSKGIRHKNIPYRNKTDKAFNPEKSILDIYIPNKRTVSAPVIIFIHGGSWNTGNKNTYKFLGKGFAKKGFITVIINYRLTPEVNYLPMAEDCATAVKWVYEHINEYGGDNRKIFISGHSAGGHLAALISNDARYFEQLKIPNPIKAALLIDPFGLDMYSYFPTSTYSSDKWFKQTFTNNPETWKKASPQYYISKNTIPQLVWIGEKTFPAIKSQGKVYAETLSNSGIVVAFKEIKKKKHIGMIFQFYRKSSPKYEQLLEFTLPYCAIPD